MLSSPTMESGWGQQAMDPPRLLNKDANLLRTGERRWCCKVCHHPLSLSNTHACFCGHCMHASPQPYNCGQLFVNDNAGMHSMHSICHTSYQHMCPNSALHSMLRCFCSSFANPFLLLERCMICHDHRKVPFLLKHTAQSTAGQVKHTGGVVG